MASPIPDAPVKTLQDSEHNTPEPSTIHQTSALGENQDPSDQSAPMEEQSLEVDLAISLLKEIMQHIAEAQVCLDDLQTFKSGIKSLARTLQAETTAVQTENNALRAEMTAVQTENTTLRADVTAVQTENITLKTEMTAVRADMTALRTIVTELTTRLATR